MSGPAIVLWWGEDGERRQVELLELVPGPPTAPGTWPRQVVHSAAEPGGWAFANLPRLGPLPDELIERLADLGEGGALPALALDRAGEIVATGSADDLHDDCLRATSRLIASRLDQPIVRENPYSSGLVLARIRDGSVLDLAPAMVRDGAVLTGVPVMAVESGDGDPAEPHALRPSAGVLDIALDGSPPATGVPSVSLELAPGEARLELLMPDLNYDALEGRWPAAAPGTRRSYLVVR
jgi:hypothetical protein